LPGAALLTSSATTSAQGGGEAARNKEILARAYKLCHDTKSGSVKDWMEIVDDGITFGSMAEGSATATFTAHVHGKQELKRYFDGLLGGWAMIRYRADYFIAEGDRVAMNGSTAWRNITTNKVCDTPRVDVWRFRDGRAIEFYEYYDTVKMMQAAT